MKEFEFTYRLALDLQKVLIQILTNTKESFPGKTILFYNHQVLNKVMEDLNSDCKKVIGKYFKEFVPVVYYGPEIRTMNTPVDQFNIVKMDVNIQSLDEKKATEYEKDWTKILETKIAANLLQLDLSKEVVIIKDRLKIVLRDYLEQVVSPLDLLFFLSEVRVVINLLTDAKTISG